MAPIRGRPTYLHRDSDNLTKADLEALSPPPVKLKVAEFTSDFPSLVHYIKTVTLSTATRSRRSVSFSFVLVHTSFTGNFFFGLVSIVRKEESARRCSNNSQRCGLAGCAASGGFLSAAK